MSGFPSALIARLRCPHDGGSLTLDQRLRTAEEGGNVLEGTACCVDCEAAFEIHDGILNLLDVKRMDKESRHEQVLRDRNAGSIDPEGPPWWQNDWNRMEMLPTLEALSVNAADTLLEFGCGDGRYTVHLADRCRWILAADFSIESLRILRRRLANIRNVGLVLGDITTMQVGAGSFDRVLSTSSPATLSCRQAMYRLAAHAVTRDGRFVFSVHHQGFWQKLMGEKKSGRYHQGGIYRYNFSVRECMDEVGPFFLAVRARPIQVHIPMAGRLRLPRMAISRFLERIPVLKHLGMLVLCVAEDSAIQSHGTAPRHVVK